MLGGEKMSRGVFPSRFYQELAVAKSGAFGE